MAHGALNPNDIARYKGLLHRVEAVRELIGRSVSRTAEGRGEWGSTPISTAVSALGDMRDKIEAALTEDPNPYNAIARIAEVPWNVCLAHLNEMCTDPNSGVYGYSKEGELVKGFKVKKEARAEEFARHPWRVKRRKLEAEYGSAGSLYALCGAIHEFLSDNPASSKREVRSALRQRLGAVDNNTADAALAVLAKVGGIIRGRTLSSGASSRYSVTEKPREEVQQLAFDECAGSVLECAESVA